MNLDSNGDGKLPYPRTVNPCINAEEEVCATIIHTLGVGKYAELDLTIQKIKVSSFDIKFILVFCL